tara:strand:+ start:4552 stop:4944 length:393 start_codon:yes stop_codon:yes gene_type:complete
MTNKVFVTAFFTQALDLLGKLSKQFPNEPNLPIYRQSLRFMSESQSASVKFMQNFYKYTLPYKQQILDKNENFFMKMDYGEQVGGTEQTFMEGIRIKTLYAEMEKPSQDAIFDYFKVLLLLCEKAKVVKD